MSIVVYGLATVTFGIKFTIVAVFQRRYGYPTIHILPLELSKVSQESILNAQMVIQDIQTS